MDRIRNYLDGLEFHDSSPEPSNSQVPSSYGVQSVNPSELVTGRVLDQKVLAIESPVLPTVIKATNTKF